MSSHKPQSGEKSTTPITIAVGVCIILINALLPSTVSTLWTPAPVTQKAAFITLLKEVFLFAAPVALTLFVVITDEASLRAKQSAITVLIIGLSFPIVVLALHIYGVLTF